MRRLKTQILQPKSVLEMDHLLTLARNLQLLWSNDICLRSSHSKRSNVSSLVRFNKFFYHHYQFCHVEAFYRVRVLELAFFPCSYYLSLALLRVCNFAFNPAFLHAPNPGNIYIFRYDDESLILDHAIWLAHNMLTTWCDLQFNHSNLLSNSSTDYHGWLKRNQKDVAWKGSETICKMRAHTCLKRSLETKEKGKEAGHERQEKRAEDESYYRGQEGWRVKF